MIKTSVDRLHDSIVRQITDNIGLQWLCCVESKAALLRHYHSISDMFQQEWCSLYHWKISSFTFSYKYTFQWEAILQRLEALQLVANPPRSTGLNNMFQSVELAWISSHVTLIHTTKRSWRRKNETEFELRVLNENTNDSLPSPIISNTVNCRETPGTFAKISSIEESPESDRTMSYRHTNDFNRTKQRILTMGLFCAPSFAVIMSCRGAR